MRKPRNQTTEIQPIDLIRLPKREGPATPHRRLRPLPRYSPKTRPTTYRVTRGCFGAHQFPRSSPNAIVKRIARGKSRAMKKFQRSEKNAYLLAVAEMINFIEPGPTRTGPWRSRHGRHSGRVSPCEREPESSTHRGRFSRQILAMASGEVVAPADHAEHNERGYWIPRTPRRRHRSRRAPFRWPTSTLIAMRPNGKIVRREGKKRRLRGSRGSEALSHPP